MVLCLYLMTICLIMFHEMCNKGIDTFLIPMFLGMGFYCIAMALYDRTITKLKSEIIELRKEIENK